MNRTQFISLVVECARRDGWRIGTNRDGLTQIDFGHKRLHAKHLEAIFPEILQDCASIPSVIEKAAPGRPCTFKPMREIISKIKKAKKRSDHFTPVKTDSARGGQACISV